MKGNWTEKDETIFDFLRKNRRFGVPFNKVYGPHCGQGIPLPELLTANAVVTALEKCGFPPFV
jgi:suppressor for copper-sensitivity B